MSLVTFNIVIWLRITANFKLIESSIAAETMIQLVDTSIGIIQRWLTCSQQNGTSIPERLKHSQTANFTFIHPAIYNYLSCAESLSWPKLGPDTYSEIETETKWRAALFSTNLRMAKLVWSFLKITRILPLFWWFKSYISLTFNISNANAFFFGVEENSFRRILKCSILS